jgi:uncharacterized repeat protein (TIGR01451 family)
LRVQLAHGLQHAHGDSIEASLSDLGPGQVKEVSLEALTSQTGKLAAEATLLTGKRVVAAAQTTVVTTDQPNLAMRQTGPLSPAVGSEHQYKLEVINRSGHELHNVEVTDLLPEGLAFAAADSHGAYEQSTRMIRWNVGTMAAGQTRQLVFRVRVRGAGAQVNRVSAHAAEIEDAKLHSLLRLGGAK